MVKSLSRDSVNDYLHVVIGKLMSELLDVALSEDEQCVNHRLSVENMIASRELFLLRYVPWSPPLSFHIVQLGGGHSLLLKVCDRKEQMEALKMILRVMDLHVCDSVKLKRGVDFWFSVYERLEERIRNS